MNEQDRKLSFNDLCGRLPYDTIVSVCNGRLREDVKLTPYHLAAFDIWDIKAYLRPMSSRTEEEKKELKSILREKDFGVDVHEELLIYTDTEYDCEYYFSDFYEVQDWLNAHHFDFRGLIPKGLALPAPEGMYELKKG